MKNSIKNIIDKIFDLKHTYFTNGFLSHNCLVGDTKVVIIDDFDGIYYTTIDKVSQIKADSSILNGKYSLDEEAFIMLESRKKYYYLYKITNKVNGMEYIGVHSTYDLEDGYMGSGIDLRQAIFEYGIENFEKELLEFFDSAKEALLAESKHVNQEYVNQPNTYKDPERNKKISEALKGKSHYWQDKVNKNPEKIRKMAEKHRGMKRSDEAKQHISDSVLAYFKEHEVSNKGMKWITNVETGERTYIDPNDPIPEGWTSGIGQTKAKGKKWYYDPNTNEAKNFGPDEVIPEGWVRGNPNLKRGKSKCKS